MGSLSVSSEFGIMREFFSGEDFVRGEGEVEFYPGVSSRSLRYVDTPKWRDCI